MRPPKSILRKCTDMRKPIQRVKFTKAVVRHGQCSQGDNDVEQSAHSVDLDMSATPFDSDNDDMEELGVEKWHVASNQKKRNKVPVVMKLKGTPASSKKRKLPEQLH